MDKLRVILLVLCLVVCASASLGQISVPKWGESLTETQDRLGPKFRTYKTSHFAVVSDANAAWVRERLGVLESTRRQYYRFTKRLKLPVIEHEDRLVCVIFAQHADYLRFSVQVDKLNAPWAGGYYTSEFNRIVMFDDRTSPAYLKAIKSLEKHRTRLATMQDERISARRGQQAELAQSLDDASRQLAEAVSGVDKSLESQLESMAISKVVHETIHLLAYNTGLQSPGRRDPIWFSEGLATTFETSTGRGAFGPGKSHKPRELELVSLSESGKTLSTAELIALHITPDASVGAVYAQSYALFEYLATRKSRDMSAYIEEMMALPWGAAVDHVDIFTKHFGSPGKYDRRIAAAD